MSPERMESRPQIRRHKELCIDLGACFAIVCDSERNVTDYGYEGYTIPWIRIMYPAPRRGLDSDDDALLRMVPHPIVRSSGNQPWNRGEWYNQYKAVRRLLCALKKDTLEIRIWE